MGCDISDSFIHQQRAYLRTFEPSQHPHPSSKSSESCSTHHFYLCDPEFRQFSICPAERESLLAERLVRRMLRGKPRSLTAQRRVCRLVYLVFLSNMHSNSYFSWLLVSLATAFRDEPKLRVIGRTRLHVQHRGPSLTVKEFLHRIAKCQAVEDATSFEALLPSRPPISSYLNP